VGGFKKGCDEAFIELIRSSLFLQALLNFAVVAIRRGVYGVFGIRGASLTGTLGKEK